ncbi:hypothetical protein ECP03047993_3434 [Escherichia coli P0304799.3]|nr:hypothetical protein ECP03047993_3434 [Escherichia coli P0304799.3]
MCHWINKHSSFYETLLKNQIIKGIFFCCILFLIIRMRHILSTS